MLLLFFIPTRSSEKYFSQKTPVFNASSGALARETETPWLHTWPVTFSRSGKSCTKNSLADHVDCFPIFLVTSLKNIHMFITTSLSLFNVACCLCCIICIFVAIILNVFCAIFIAPVFYPLCWDQKADLSDPLMQVFDRDYSPEWANQGKEM